MQEDLGMTDIEWSAGISLFYVGYLISQVPANVIMAKGSPRILFPICMLGWSFVTIAMPAMKSPWSFMLCRFLVGFTEGPSVPLVSLLCSSWYTSAESPLRSVDSLDLASREGSAYVIAEWVSGMQATSSRTLSAVSSRQVS